MFFKRKILKNKTILANFSYLTILQLFTILSPLLTYPYLLRILGLELYGVIIFAQTIVTYISLIVNFGFNISSSRDIAIYKNNIAELSKIVSVTYSCKFILWLVCLFIYYIVIGYFDFFKPFYWVYFWSYFLTFNELLLPVWFFQGVEKMKYITISNIGSRIIFIVAIFLFIKRKDQFLFVPILNGLGSIMSGFISLYILFAKEHISLIKISIYDIKQGYNKSLPLFISSVSTQMYVNINKLLVGAFLEMKDVAIYDVVEKILKFISLPIAMIAQSTFPKISREKNIQFVNMVMQFVFVVVFFEYFFIMFFAEEISFYFIGEFVPKIKYVMIILCSSALFVSFNMFLGGNRLVPFGYSYIYMGVMIRNCLFFLTGVLVLYLFSIINIYSLSIMSVFVEIFCLLNLLFYNKKFNLL